MEFEGQYLTYNEYKGLGGTLDQASFNLLEFEVQRQVDERTLNRLKNIDIENIPQEVKLCIFNLMDSIEDYNKTINKSSNVKSENTDGYSISYLSPSEINEIIKLKNNDLNNTITTYLYGIIVNNEHLIYIGAE